MTDVPADGHVHTEWSWDTGAPPGQMDAMCRRARELGVPGVVFSDHLDLIGWQVEPADLVGYERFAPYVTTDGLLVPPVMDIEGYLAEVERCRATYPDLHIVTGTELGQPHRTGEQAARLPGFDGLDRVLGSMHMLHLDGRDYEPAGAFRLMPAAEVIRAYLAEVMIMVDSGADFAVLTHIDYAVRYWPARDHDGGALAPFDELAYEDELRQALRAVARSGRALELNVAGGLRPWVARWWADEGGEALTFGGDAHHPDKLAAGFAAAADLARDCGFRPGRSPVDPWTRGRSVAAPGSFDGSGLAAAT